MKDENAGKLLATLKRHNPFKVRAYNGEDDVREIAVPQRRRRWATVIEAIEAKPWTRVELLDKSGAVLGYADNEGPARDAEDLAPSFAGVGGQLMLGERIAALAMKSVREAMASRDEETRALLQAQGAVVREMATAVTALGEVYQAQREAAEDAAESRAEAAVAANGGQVKELLDALPQLLQLLPLVKGLLGSGDAPAPNGARKH